MVNRADNIHIYSTYFFLDYLLSNNHVNSIIIHKFDFSNEEVFLLARVLLFSISIYPSGFTVSLNVLCYLDSGLLHFVPEDVVIEAQSSCH